MQYEAALALTETTATGPVRRGLDMLDRLGAAAVADKVRLDLRAAGVTAVPARRRTSSLANPVGLTSRQIEVLHLMDDGLTNAELAARLYLSAKTVDHHVSAILAKLNVPNRREAVRRGRDAGDHRRRSAVGDILKRAVTQARRSSVAGAVCSSTKSAISSVTRPGASSIGMWPTPVESADP